MSDGAGAGGGGKFAMNGGGGGGGGGEVKMSAALFRPSRLDEYPCRGDGRGEVLSAANALINAEDAAARVKKEKDIEAGKAAAIAAVELAIQADTADEAEAIMRAASAHCNVPSPAPPSIQRAAGTAAALPRRYARVA
jgi:hypothetical protein